MVCRGLKSYPVFPIIKQLGGGFNFYFHPYLGKIPILTNIFQMGWNHQLEYYQTTSWSVFLWILEVKTCLSSRRAGSRNSLVGPVKGGLAGPETRRYLDVPLEVGIK